MTLGDIRKFMDKGKLTTNSIGFNSSRPALSGNYSYIDYGNKQKTEDDLVLEAFEKVKEIIPKVNKILDYAEKNKFDTQETLEAFFTEEELDLFENFSEIKKNAEQIIEKRKLEEEIKKKLITNYGGLATGITYPNITDSGYPVITDSTAPPIGNKVYNFFQKAFNN